MATASIDPPQSRGHLLRVLGLGFGIAMGVGSVIGAGILRTPGTVLGHVPLPWLALGLWAFAGLHALLTANIVAELMAALPKSGGLFNVARRAFGEFGALLVGWTDWLSNVAAAAALAIVCAEFLAIIFPLLGAHLLPTGVAVALLLFALNWVGVREASFAQIVTSLAKAALLIALILLIFLFRPTPAARLDGGVASAPIGFFAIVVAYQLIVGTYTGWTGPAYFAEEERNPARNIPRAMFGALAAVIAIYLLMNAALLYALPADRLSASELPVALAISDIFGAASVAVVAAVAVVSVVGTINASIMMGTRILHGLGRDGLLPAATSRVNKGGTPDVAMALSAAAVVGLALTGQFETVFLIVGALSLAILALIDLAFFKLRWSEPELPRPWRARLYPWLPALALILDVGVLVAFLASDLDSALFMLGGIALCIPLTLIARLNRTPAEAR
ncbi:APC family permease [Allosphingosinicella sp.]|jgi:APA family basic amino acid/polyamine antiporter|uniref:APC family permease n=1 Tax=Allosphingosinicella sp. TaxID=2823234 RepID=UPI002EE93E71